jgi:Fe-S-cluster containining protein
MSSTALRPENIIEFVDSSRVQTSRGAITWIKFGTKSRKKAMCLREVSGRCLFLKARRCGVYEDRPFVCREHPFIVKLDDTGRSIHSIGLNKASACSHTLSGKVSKVELKRLHRLNLAQDEQYSVKVRQWNRRKNPGSEKDFIQFLGL